MTSRDKESYVGIVLGIVGGLILVSINQYAFAIGLALNGVYSAWKLR